MPRIYIHKGPRFIVSSEEVVMVIISDALLFPEVRRRRKRAGWDRRALDTVVLIALTLCRRFIRMPAAA